MAIFEFSEDFDAQGWYYDQMSKGRSFESDEDPYGWDEPMEYPSQGVGRKSDKQDISIKNVTNSL